MILRAVRVVLALGLALSFSGVPQVVSAASSDCCEERCEGNLTGSECPPTCSMGACAKVRSAIDPGTRAALDVPVAREWTCAIAHRRPALPIVTSGVFHPPRA